MEILQCDICKTIKDVSREHYPIGQSSDGYDGITTDFEIIDICTICKVNIYEAALRQVTEKIKYGYGIAVTEAIKRRRKS